MKQTVSPIGQRIALKLDVGMAFEALILNRLARVPNTRRQEWLRGLLVQGFQYECRALRKLQHGLDPGCKLPSEKQKPVVHRSLQPASYQAPMSKPNLSAKPESVASELRHSSGEVSFAALRKVIG